MAILALFTTLFAESITAPVPTNVPVFLTTKEGGPGCKYFYNKDRNDDGVYCSSESYDD